jgi:hypothetical protein
MHANLSFLKWHPCYRDLRQTIFVANQRAVQLACHVLWFRPLASSKEGRTLHPDLILINGRFTTLDRANPNPQAVAIANGRFSAVGDVKDILASRHAATKTIDLRGRRVIPGLIDSHIHVIRGGLNYNMELRWDGVPSLADGMEMLRKQAQNTPCPQWVRVVGGFTEHQFSEKRLPTIDELNAAAPDTPVFILHLYDRALLNRAALRAVGYTRDTPNPPGGRDRARWCRRAHRFAAGASERDHPVRDAREGPEACARVPAEFDASFHA